MNPEEVSICLNFSTLRPWGVLAKAKCLHAKEKNSPLPGRQRRQASAARTATAETSNAHALRYFDLLIKYVVSPVNVFGISHNCFITIDCAYNREG